MAGPFQSLASVVAAFPGPDKAKSAMAALERNGTPSNDVRLLNDVSNATPTDVYAADARKLHWLGRRVVYGLLIGAVIGAGIMMVVVALVHGGGAVVWVGSAFGGALFGGVVGAMVSVGTRTPRNPDAWDTYLIAHKDQACLAVALRNEGDDEKIATILRREGAVSLERLPSAVSS